jgi:hypothetical protein
MKRRPRFFVALCALFWLTASTPLFTLAAKHAHRSPAKETKSKKKKV